MYNSLFAPIGRGAIAEEKYDMFIDWTFLLQQKRIGLHSKNYKKQMINYRKNAS